MTSYLNIILLGALVGNCWLICFPVMIYSWCRYYQQRDDPFIQNRCPMVVRWCGAVLIADIILGQPMIFCVFFEIISISRTILYCYMGVYGTAITVSLLLRFWLAIFRQKYQIEIASKQWKSIVNPNTNNDTFWIKYKSTLGM